MLHKYMTSNFIPRLRQKRKISPPVIRTTHLIYNSLHYTKWKKITRTCSRRIPSVLDASFTSCSSEEASSKALKADSVVTAVTLRIPLAIPSSDKRANALASLVFGI